MWLFPECCDMDPFVSTQLKLVIYDKVLYFLLACFGSHSNGASNDGVLTCTSNRDINSYIDDNFPQNIAVFSTIMTSHQVYLVILAFSEKYFTIFKQYTKCN